MIKKTVSSLVLSAIALQVSQCEAFVPSHLSQRQAFLQRDNYVLYSSNADTLPEIASMRVGELKKELDSYGISTKSFFEKSELAEAVQKARDEGRKPVNKSTTQTKTTSSTSSSSTSTARTETKSREERIAEEMEKCLSMKAGDMKKELQSMGVSTKSFFEKSEFLKALAEARVDGVKKVDTSNDEEYAEYAEVEVLPANDPGPRKKSDNKEQASAGAGNPFGGAAGAGNPFGGAAGGNPFGGAAGMGGMGGMADMFKNMGGSAGGMGGMGNMADMFKNMGGMGGMGDMMGNMGKAQEMMKNPKVMEIIQKAQGNPKIMQAVTECMSNPAAFAKYQNDPEIGSLINELKKYM